MAPTGRIMDNRCLAGGESLLITGIGRIEGEEL